MDRIGNTLKARRQQLGLKIEDVSERTKIRPHLIKSIEEGERDVMPAVYIKSFVKTYATFLGLSEGEIDNLLKELEPAKPSKIVPATRADQSANPVAAAPKTSKSVERKEPEKKESSQLEPKEPPAKEKNSDRPAKISEPAEQEATNYKELFKKKSVKKTSNVSVANVIIYALLILGVIAIIFFTFFYDSAVENAPPASIDTTKKESKEEGSGILSYFDAPDSLALTARARDTVWVRLEIDGVKSEEIIIKPGQEAVWHAKDYFLVSHGNIGGVDFYLDGNKLPLFGKRRSVARNIKITKDGALGLPQETTPQTNAPAQPNVAPTDRSTPNADSQAKRSRRYSSRKKEKKATPPPMILESPPVRTQPPSLNSTKTPR